MGYIISVHGVYRVSFFQLLLRFFLASRVHLLCFLCFFDRFFAFRRLSEESSVSASVLVLLSVVEGSLFFRFLLLACGCVCPTLIRIMPALALVFNL